MMFECDGTRYDTCEMDRVDTDAPRGPAVFMTRDLRCIFVQTWDSWEGVLIHRADVPEIERLWLTYRAAPLLPVLALIGRAPGSLSRPPPAVSPAPDCRHPDH